MASWSLAALLLRIQGSLALGCADQHPLVETTSIPSFGPWLPKFHRFSFTGEQTKALELLRWHNGKESACQCRRLRIDPWVRKIPWSRKWQPTPVFLPGKLHGQRSLAGYSPWGGKEPDMTEQLSARNMHTKSLGTGALQGGWVGMQAIQAPSSPWPCTDGWPSSC